MRSKTHHLWTVKACVCVLRRCECLHVGSLGGPSTSLCGLERMSVQPGRVSLPITPLHPESTNLMAGYHGKSFSTCQLFTCIFTAQVSAF